LPDGLSFDLLAGALRADARDNATFLDVLAAKLEDVLPGRVQVRRAGGLLRKTHPVTELEVGLGEERFHIHAPAPGALEARHSRAVRGIVLKSEAMPLPEWIDALSHALMASAEESEADRVALERLLQ
jgi:hypothetical protein